MLYSDGLIMVEYGNDVVLFNLIGRFVKVWVENYGIIVILIYKYEGEGIEW